MNSSGPSSGSSAYVMVTFRSIGEWDSPSGLRTFAPDLQPPTLVWRARDNQTISRSLVGSAALAASTTLKA
jgi:hypothetical protein